MAVGVKGLMYVSVEGWLCDVCHLHHSDVNILMYISVEGWPCDVRHLHPSDVNILLYVSVEGWLCDVRHLHTSDDLHVRTLHRHDDGVRSLPRRFEVQPQQFHMRCFRESLKDEFVYTRDIFSSFLPCIRALKSCRKLVYAIYRRDNTRSTVV